MTTGDTTSPALRLAHISKKFGGVYAVRDAELLLAEGEIHGLLGQNGSGKSTLIKILAGYHAPEPGGTVELHGRPVTLPIRPGTTHRLGLSFVHQDLGLVEDLTVLDNMRVGRYGCGPAGPIRWRSERRAVSAIIGEFDLECAPDTRVGHLSDVDRALVAIVRAVRDVRELHDGGVLVLNEPTVYLPRDSLERLFATMKAVAERGTAILFVTHQLGEVKRITDRVTVLRDARVVATVDTPAVTEEQLAALILGREIGRLYPDASPRQERETVLAVDDLQGRGLRDVSFDVSEGETIGLTGLVGSGFDEVLYVVFGAREGSGRLRLSGRSLDLSGMSPAAAIDAGLALVPANRLRDAVVAHLTVQENVGLPLLRSHSKHLRLRIGPLTRAVRDVTAQFDVRPPDTSRTMATLSGGNQQKAVLAKWLQTQPSVILLHEPTQGVDVGARSQIFRLIRDATLDGTAVVVASSEHEDLAHLCDRVFVFHDGTVRSVIERPSLSPEAILDEIYRPS